MNLYGFAGGDPVNFADPFGLCPADRPLCNWIKVALIAAGSDLGFIAGGGAGLLTGPGALVASPAGAIAGVAFGAALGLAAGEFVDRVFFSENAGSGGGRDAGAAARDWLSQTNRANPGLNRDISKWFKEGGELPKSITREYLEKYLDAARDAIARNVDRLGVQARRVSQIEEALRNMR